MSWLAKLYETYNNFVGLSLSDNENLLWPKSHFVKNSHVEVVIDAEGNFLEGRAKVLNGKDSPTLIPATESSAGRSGSKIAPHPLCEEIGYCAADYPKADLKKITAYMEQLKKWTFSKNSHPKIKSIYKYLLKKTLWADLSKEFDFPLKILKTDGSSEKKSPEKVFIRWRVELPGSPVTGTWEDDDLIKSWILHDEDTNYKKGFCYFLGKEVRIASNHPKFLRWPGDGSKLISSNDHSGFTFRGRFTDTKKSIQALGAQAVCIGFEVTQKAHNALRWLISRQGHKNGDQVFITWAVTGNPVPSPMEGSWALMNNSSALKDLSETSFVVAEEEDLQQSAIDHGRDSGQSFAEQFNKYLSGYRARFKLNDQIVVMGIDSASPGRMGIIYYRELFESDFFRRLKDWHTQFSWFQRVTIEVPNKISGKKPLQKHIWPISAPAPSAIAGAAYGDVLKTNSTLRKNVLERIVPCIIDGRQFPRDILSVAIRRACNRNVKRLSEQYSNQQSENAEWEKHLCIACALYKGFYQRHQTQRRKYSMSLDEQCTSRDYLYGRLLAIAERIEEVALRLSEEKRPTNAARLMQRFAERPCSTWRTIELSLQPYMQRLQGPRAPFLTERKKELDAVTSAFLKKDFTLDQPLTGEFLLGYHCQRMSYRNTTPKTNEEIANSQEETNES